MAVDIVDLFKYGWMLLLAIVPKHLTSMNTRFKLLEKRDIEMSEKIAVLSTNVDNLTKSSEELKGKSDNILEILTELRIRVARDVQ